MEHKAAVRRGDRNNGIVVYSLDEDHKTDWENTSIRLRCGTTAMEEEGTGGSTHPDTAPHEQSRLS